MARRRYSAKRGKEDMENSDKCNCRCHRGPKGACGGFYFLGFLGALIYYMMQGEGIVGILKALVWPVFLVMKVLGL
jgi:hypothetical protein